MKSKYEHHDIISIVAERKRHKSTKQIKSLKMLTKIKRNVKMIRVVAR